MTLRLEVRHSLPYCRQKSRLESVARSLNSTLRTGMEALMERAAEEMLMACDGEVAVAAIPIDMAIAMEIRFNITLSLVCPARLPLSGQRRFYVPDSFRAAGRRFMLRNRLAGFVLR